MRDVAFLCKCKYQNFHWDASGLQGDAGWIFKVDPQDAAAPFTDAITPQLGDITGRSADGGPRLIWMESVQLKCFAWAAKYPQTSVFGQ